MKTKRITYLAAALGLVLAGSSCEHKEIYEPLEFSARLDPANTYRVGEPVTFNFEGNADYITVWNGDLGHEYRYRERTSVPMDYVESATLQIRLRQQYGNVNCLDLIASKEYQGLNGKDADADRQIVEAIGNDYNGWEVLEYTPNKSNIVQTYTYDITKYKENFAFGMHFFQEAGTAMRTYFIDPKVIVHLKDYGEQIHNYSSLNFITFSLANEHTSDPYIHNKDGNGNVKLAGETGANNAANIVFPGFSAGAAGMPNPVNQWVLMQPMALNKIAPDTGQSIKGVTDDTKSYTYTYERPGTYTVTFLVGNGNYQGESGIQTYEMTVTIIDPIE